LGRRPRIKRLRKRRDVAGLERVLAERDFLSDGRGNRSDLAVARRLEAVGVLAEIAEPPAREVLVKALGDPDLRVRAAALDAIIEGPDRRSAEGLARMVALWRDPRLEPHRQRALTFLAEYGDPTLGVAYAEALLDADSRAQLGEREAAGLRRIFALDGANGATAALAHRAVPRLTSEDAAERDRAAVVVRALGSGAVDALVGALDAADMRVEAATALGVLRDTSAVPGLLRVLSLPDGSVGRVAAARALGAIRDPQSVEGLMAATSDRDPDVREAAQDAVDRMGTVAVLVGVASFMRPVLRRLEALEGRGPSPAPMPVRLAARPLLRRLLGR